MSMTATATQPPDTVATFNALYAAHAGDVTRRVRHYIADPHDAEEVCQEVWHNVYDALPKTTERVHWGWLQQIAHNEAINRLRERQKPTRQTIPLMLMGEDGCEYPLSEVQEIEGDREAAIDRWELLKKLRPKDRLILTLSGVGYSYMEIGERMCRAGYPLHGEYAVRCRLARARQKLREMQEQSTIAENLAREN